MSTRLLFFIASLVAAWPASAGYYLQLISSTGNWPSAGWISSGCYLIPSMAITGQLGFLSTTITGFSADPPSMTVTSNSSWFNPATTYKYVFSIKHCNLSPTVGAIPVFSNGVTDPAISGESILSGSGGTTSTSTPAPAPAPVEVTVQLEQPPIAFIDPQEAIDNASQWFGLTALLWASAWGGRRVYDLFTQSS